MICALRSTELTQPSAALSRQGDCRRPPRLNVTFRDWPCSWLTRRSAVSHRHLVQRLHLVVPAVLDQQNSFALAQWRDDPAGEPEHGGLGGGAVARHQRPAAL